MKKIYFLLIFIATLANAQTITVDNTTNSPTQLVNLLLGNSCVTVSNVSISSNQSVAYFNKNGGGFPINDGIIIRNGQALLTQGSYTNTNLSSQINTNGDAYLQTLSNNSGQTDNITDVAFLEFDFTPISNSFSFDFLFASNEYGQYQCGFSDVFAFVLTNLNTGVSTNLAVIPGTSTPVTVKNIRDSANNVSPSNCASINPNFFGVYNVNNPGASTLNMRGHTIVMNTSSVVIPNTPYKIRLMIGDYYDSTYDSAVFLASGSFTTSLDLGPDRSICNGDSYLLNTNLDATYTYQWFINGGPIPLATNASYTVTQPGTYTVEITKGTCFITDTIVFNDLAVNTPINLSTCNTGSATYNYDLTTNNETQLGIDNAIYNVFYYTSLANITANNPIPAANLTNYTSTGGETIYIKIFNTQTGQFCDAVYTFDLIVTNPVNATAPADVTLCTSPNGVNYDLTQLNPQVLNGQPAANYTITYYNTQAEATAGTNAIGANYFIPSGTTNATVWIQLLDNSNSSCFDVVSVNFIINPLPAVDTIADPLECNSYTLPIIANGTYYLLPGGPSTPGQLQYNPGDSIDASGTYYVFAGPDANGCTNESSFNAYFIDEFVISEEYCGTFTVPAPPFGIGAFYTATGGPTGAGTLIPTGTAYTNTTQATQFQTVYYYADVNALFCKEEQFDVSIYAIPLVDDPIDITTCDSYTLPALTDGSYFTASGGTGTPLNAGDPITISQTVYVFNSNPNCTAENAFDVNIVDTSLFQPIARCGSYTLPPIPFGGYYTAPGGPTGTGTLLDPSIDITTSQIVYYYANTTGFPNCTDNLNYDITIHPKPAVDAIAGGTYCGEFPLPVLTSGTYYALSGGPSIPGQIQYNAGEIIDLTGTQLNPGTYYVYADPDAFGCDNETSFTINLNPYPITDEIFDTNRVECGPYSIAQPVNGTVYTATGGPTGGGNVVLPTDVFNTTNTFYLYNMDPATGCSINKLFTVTYSALDLPNYPDVNVCEMENYTLPALTHVPPTPFNYAIGYFYDQGGLNPVPNGTVFNTPNTQIPIWVYATNGDRKTCVQEDGFVINVSETPVLPAYVTGNEYCGSYTLPAFPATNYTVNYYSQPGGVGLIAPANYIYTAPTTSGTHTVFVYATATNNTNCNDEAQFTFTVHPLLDIHLTDGIICVDSETGEVLRSYTINTGLNPAIYTVNWSLNGALMGTGPSYTATQEGTYDVEFIKLIPSVGADCNYNSTTVTVTKSGPAVATYVVSSAFENHSSITVTITGGYGDYLFQLEYPDGTLGLPQTGNVFGNLNSGVYYVNIDDQKGGCSPTRIGPIHIINYPHFFTPNDDAYNNSWNIWDLSYQPDARIYIFDRFGKFIKQLSPAGQGWDGTYNGEQLPSTDYWFKVNYRYNEVDQEFKAHFSMKR
jgi:gliding motility-associated-like protein